MWVKYTPTFKMFDCQNLKFSPDLAAQRLANAELSSSLPALKRLLCFALFLLGANRTTIAGSIDLPLDTAKSILKALQRDGLSALEDRRGRRGRRPLLPPAPQIPVAQVELSKQGNDHMIQLGSSAQPLTISPGEPLAAQNRASHLSSERSSDQRSRGRTIESLRRTCRSLSTRATRQRC